VLDEPRGHLRDGAGTLSQGLERDPARREPIGADFPIGGLAAGAAVAAIALEAALPHVESATGVTRSDRPRPSAGPPVEIDLLRLFPALRSTVVDLGRLDVISGGAITNAFIYALLWFHRTTAQIRVIEKDSDSAAVGQRVYNVATEMAVEQTLGHRQIVATMLDGL
jgi:hypothetical protein